MPTSISDFLATAVDYAWGTPLVVLLMGGGLVLLGVSLFLPMRGFLHAFKLTVGRFHHPGDAHAGGQITHFQALCNALAATIGLGNIAGVAVALTQGGPGAIFWMWVAALIGMNTKFFECTLAVMYRGVDHMGQVQGGPMYVIDTALGPRWKPMSLFFAVCGLIGTMALFQMNQIASFIDSTYIQPAGLGQSEGGYPWPRLIIGLVIASTVAYICLGGIRRIAHWSSAIVPFMCLFYVVAAVVVIVLNLDRVPDVFAVIFTEAFTGHAAVGGAQGATIAAVIQIGVKRAAFSNEAGVGTAPMAHSNVRTSEPVSEGLVAMIGPFLDTIIVCTMTALVIMISLDPADYAVGVKRDGVQLSRDAFEATLGSAGVHCLGIAVFLFGFSTMIGMANYNAKCWHYLFRGRFFLNHYVFVLFFCSTLVAAAVSEQADVVNLLDIGFALMAVPNMIATLRLSPRVKRALEVYLREYCSAK